jgi:hypothetical protein
VPYYNDSGEIVGGNIQYKGTISHPYQPVELQDTAKSARPVELGASGRTVNPAGHVAEMP